MDIAGLIASFATEGGTYTVTRRTGSTTVVRGRVEEPPATTLTITASISPASGRDLQRLPEGRMSYETRVLFTATQLYVGGQNETYQTDQVTISGELWEVQHVESWLYWDGIQKGFKCILQKP